MNFPSPSTMVTCLAICRSLFSKFLLVGPAHQHTKLATTTSLTHGDLPCIRWTSVQRSRDLDLFHASVHWRPTSSHSPPTPRASSDSFSDSPLCASVCALNAPLRSWAHARVGPPFIQRRRPCCAHCLPDLWSSSSLSPEEISHTPSPRCCPLSRRNR